MRSVFKYTICKPLAILLATILTPFLYIVASSLFAVTITVLFIYRLFIITVAKFKIPDGRILEKLDSLLSFGQEYTSTNMYVTVQVMLEGRVEVDDVRKDMKTLIVNHLSPNGDFKYPEMQEYLHYFGGYAFRRRIKNFDANNYIHRHPNPSNSFIDKLKMLEIRKNVHETLFSEKGPLWSLTVVNNYRHTNSENDVECTAVIVKFHHTLCDGIGAVSVVYTNLAGHKLDLPKLDKSAIKYKCFSIYQLFRLLPLTFIVIFKFIMKMVYKRSSVFNTHAWHELGHSDYKRPTKFEMWESEPIDKKIFREIKSTCNVTVMSVLVNVITGGMRRMMVAKGLVPPKDIRISYPLPAANHPGTFTNKAYLTTIRIPFSIDDCKKRLRATDQKIKSLDNLIILKFLLKLGYVVPNFLKLTLIYDNFNSAIVACTPLPPIEPKIFGHKQLSISSCVGFRYTNTGCLVSVLGINDSFHTTIQINSRLLDHPDEVRDLEKYILEELDFLAKECLT